MLVGAKFSMPFVNKVAAARVLLPGSQVNEALAPMLNARPPLVRAIFPPFITTEPFTVRFPVTESVLAVLQVSLPF